MNNKNVTYNYFWDKINFDENFFDDKVHFSVKGYEYFFNEIQFILNNI